VPVELASEAPAAERATGVDKDPQLVLASLAAYRSRLGFCGALVRGSRAGDALSRDAKDPL
jgi:hypothetical protein